MYAPKRSNCIIWALCARHVLGGKIKCRKSRLWFGPHWYLTLPDGTSVGYSQKKPGRFFFLGIPWYKWWFKGELISEATLEFIRKD